MLLCHYREKKTNVPINYHNIIMVDNFLGGGGGGLIFFSFNSCQHPCKGALLQWIE